MPRLIFVIVDQIRVYKCYNIGDELSDTLIDLGDDVYIKNRTFDFTDPEKKTKNW